MARRGNQQKTGVDRRTSKPSKKGLDSELCSPKSLVKEKERDVTTCSIKTLSESENGVSDLDDINQCENMKFSRDHSEIDERVVSENIFSDGQTSSSRTDSLHGNETTTIKLVRRFKPILSQLYLTCGFISTKYFSILKIVNMWVELQKPNITFLKRKLLLGCDFVKLKLQQAYPVFLKLLVRLCSILLLLLIIWIDCAIRGINSFVRLGTVSFFSVFWFSLFSIAAMAGMIKLLIVLVIAGLVGAFVGLILGIFILAISGIIFLWLYGSFWTTMLVISLAALAFMAGHQRLTLFTATIYSMYSAWAYVGWIGLLLALNLSFFSSAILLVIISSLQSSSTSDQTSSSDAHPRYFRSNFTHPPTEMNPNSPDRGTGVTSTSGAESDLTPEEEVARILGCHDHYQALGLPRYGNIDSSLLKREYKKKAIMVHPDKNFGNENAVEAFKKLQNAYEVLLDSFKRKTYDDELRNEELMNYLKRFHSTSLKNRRNGWFSHSEEEKGNLFEDSRNIACEKCNGFHIWIITKKIKSRARWCHDCNEFHQVKDGDGWVEQFPQPFLFGFLHKVDSPSAYVCADSKIYEVTEWFLCQEMRCPANTHKPSFHVNTSLISKPSNGAKRSNSWNRNSKSHSGEDESTMKREEFDPWFPNPSAGASSSGKRKKKGKKPW